MAGYTNGVEFHINDDNVSEKIKIANWSEGHTPKRVMTLMLDGDELAAALWGLDNFQKSQGGVAHESMTDLLAANRELSVFPCMYAACTAPAEKATGYCARHFA